MPLLFVLGGPKMGTRYPDKREIWHGEPSLVPNFTFIGQKCGNTVPKTVKISNFGHKFAFRGDSFALFLQNFQRLYASIGSF